MSEPMQVILGEKQAQELRDFVYQLVSDSVDAAKRDAGISQKWLRKTEASSYAGVSPVTFNKWVRNGLQCHVINGTVLVSKSDIDKFINRNGI
ncbi:hypothetical protein [Lactobacillus plantarum subsp. plantarum] [Lactiplantibacillus mudanjiangensis]|uniref:helix-turn-helix domain-containing protein n=1 Tax=Lactiplantibacillus mudanjiangensis TaxID=1296538 RepID=UPI0010151FEC|nr:hypothetical protein [Lactobacillus plantarum subsp. plantarum] [Lactiplantibacillus mudanjiangensis]